MEKTENRARKDRGCVVFRNASVVVTCAPIGADSLGRVKNGVVVSRGGIVEAVGSVEEIGSFQGPCVEVDAKGGAVLPGFVDCHTHTLHLGDRSHEFALRATGATYLEIAAAGGGILSTVEQVRRAPKEALVEVGLLRMRRRLEKGVTTVEIKSGYGLSTDAELKMLRAVREIGRLQPVETIATFLGAHTCPPEYRSDPEKYVNLVVNEMIPAVADEGLARFCDVYVEQGAFSVEQARKILLAALGRGLRPKIHADQFHALGACALARELDAVSVDHLEASTPNSIQSLLGGSTVAVLLPLCEIYLGKGAPAPGRAIVDAGIDVAVATDFNPGSANGDDLLLAAMLSVTRSRLTVDEALLAITRNAAKAVGRADLGRIAPGCPCDLVVLDTDNPLRLVSDMGVNHVAAVYKNGVLVV